MKKIALIVLIILLVSQWTLVCQTINNETAFLSDDEDPKKNKSLIQGRVINDTGEEIPFANIYIENTNTGTVSDFNGNYKLEIIEPGEYKITCTFISYKPTDKIIKINNGQQITVNFILREDVLQLAEVEIRARSNKESEVLLLMQRKNATTIIENIGSTELSRKGVSDASAGIKKVTGISVTGSKSISVRGLGDRYNRTQLNSISTASPNPDKMLMPLDLFPTNIISNIEVNKTYSVRNYADYSGAIINIQTKNMPEDDFFNVKYGVGINTNTTFKDFKISNTSGSWITPFNLNKRIDALNPEFKKYEIKNLPNNGSNPFSIDFGYQTLKAIPNQSLGFNTGKNFRLKNNNQLGIILNSTFSNDFIYTYGRDNIIKSDGSTMQNFNFGDYSYNTTFSNLAGISYSIKNTTVSYNFIYLNNSLDAVIEKNGYDKENYHLFIRTNIFKNHNLAGHQLVADHSFNDKWSINLSAGYSKGTSHEPDRRGIVFIDNKGIWNLFTLNSQETSRYFAELYDKTYAVNGGAVYNITDKRSNKKKGQIAFGINSMIRNRDFYSYNYFYNISDLGSLPADINNPESVINDEAFENNDISIKNFSQERDKYFANLRINALYFEYITDITNNLTISLGVRGEQSDQSVKYWNDAGKEKITEIDTIDFYPAMHLKYKLNDKANLRLSVSKTLTRADFKEMAPFQYSPSYGSEFSRGNENIKNTQNYNADIKYEYFPEPGEIISLGIYGKILKNPIERITKGNAGSVIFTYDNAKRGIVYGAEFEFKKKIYNRFFLGFNASYIYSNIELNPNSSNTFKERPMEGASPYLINADVFYRLINKENFKIDISIVYNIYGKRLFAVGDDGRGDIYELSNGKLDVIINTTIKEKLNIGLDVKNILNPYHKFIQYSTEFDPDTMAFTKKDSIEKSKYKTGLYMSLSISYNF